MSISKYWRRLSQKRTDEGATAVEYGLLVALIAVVIAVAAMFLGQALNSQIQGACEAVANDNGSPCFEAPAGP